MMTKKIAIIGAGPAGIFTALQLSSFDGEVHVFEQNPMIGKKLEGTGGGRMNVTNKVFTEKEFTSSQPNLLKRLFKNPWVKNREAIFAEMGVEYEWEGNRAILKSQDASLEVQRLSDMLEDQANCTLHLKTEVKKIVAEESGFTLTVIHDSQEEELNFTHVVLAEGGMFRIGRPSVSEDLYALPLSFGHSITELSPSLSSLIIPSNPFRELSGISIRAELIDPETNVKRTDEMLIAHHGFSGPLPLDFSSLLSGTRMQLNVLPDLKEEEFTERFNSLRQGRNSVRSLLREYLPKRLADWYLSQAGIGVEDMVADTSKEKLKLLRKLLYRYMLEDVKTLDYSGCWTTKGGIDLSEVNTATLESKLHKNLYFAGEVLDVNGMCGGYNISFAAISAKIVGEGIVKD